MSLTLDPEDREALGYGAIDNFDFAAILEERRRPHYKLRLPRRYNRVCQRAYRKPWLWASQRAPKAPPVQKPRTHAERRAFNLSIPWPA